MYFTTTTIFELRFIHNSNKRVMTYEMKWERKKETRMKTKTKRFAEHLPAYIYIG